VRVIKRKHRVVSFIWHISFYFCTDLDVVGLIVGLPSLFSVFFFFFLGVILPFPPSPGFYEPKIEMGQYITAINLEQFTVYSFSKAIILK
jgi:hypothetical protein